MWKTASRKELLEKASELFDQVEEDFASPYWEGNRIAEIEDELELGTRRYPILSALFPAVSQMHNAKERATANRDGMLLAIAAHRYRLQNGEWPSSSPQVVRTYLKQTPIDRINGEPLKVVVDKDVFKVYSVGPDGDDDQGRSILIGTEGSTPSAEQDYEQWMNEHETKELPASGFSFVYPPHHEGDWVIWPRRSEQ